MDDILGEIEPIIGMVEDAGCDGVKAGFKFN